MTNEHDRSDVHFVFVLTLHGEESEAVQIWISAQNSSGGEISNATRASSLDKKITLFI